ncbi:MAG TPA: glycosyltransferase family 2 protein [Atribacterota bacterium]|nr:glycosyltransferase family 2 protein [Atribacterota bacterium]
MDKKVQNEAISDNLLPLVSIITVCYNSEKFITDTIESVLNQTYKKYEYIIVDGGSTDNTLKIIQNYKEHISILISEPDKGVYDAMNKGAGLAKGEWTIFLNSGDRFYKSNTLENIFYQKNYFVDFIYGDCKVTYNSGFSRIAKARKIEELWKGMVFSHQSLFTNIEVFKEYKFNIDNKIVGDFEFIYRCYLKGYKFYYLNFPVAEILAGGLSDINRIGSILSRWKTVKKYSNESVIINIYYLSLLMENFVKSLLKSILPKRVYNILLERKYSIKSEK